MTPTSLDALLAEARQRSPADALALLDAASPELADAPLARYARGTVLYELGRFADAVTEFRAATDASPGTPDFTFNLALALLAEARAEQGEPRRAHASEAQTLLLSITDQPGATSAAHEAERRAAITHLLGVARSFSE